MAGLDAPLVCSAHAAYLAASGRVLPDALTVSCEGGRIASPWSRWSDQGWGRGRRRLPFVAAAKDGQEWIGGARSTCHRRDLAWAATSRNAGSDRRGMVRVVALTKWSRIGARAVWIVRTTPHSSSRCVTRGSAHLPAALSGPLQNPIELPNARTISAKIAGLAWRGIGHCSPPRLQSPVCSPYDCAGLRNLNPEAMPLQWRPRRRPPPPGPPASCRCRTRVSRSAQLY